MFEKYGRVYGGYTLAYDFLVINEPELIRQVFVKNFDIFPDRIVGSLGPSPKVNKMVVFMDGNEDWRRIRSVLTPAFTSRKIKSLMPYISEISDELVKNLENIERNGIVKHYKN